MIKYKQVKLLILAAMVTGISMWFLDSTSVIGAMAGAFLGAASAYTALDLRAVIKSTGQLPAGEFCEANLHKYVATLVMLSILFLEAIIRQFTKEVNLELTLGFLGPGLIGLIGIIIAGLKTNKTEMLRDGKSK